MTGTERIAALVGALVFHLASMVVFCIGVWAAWHGDYARGTFFLVLALCFDNYGDYNANRVAR